MTAAATQTPSRSGHPAGHSAARWFVPLGAFALAAIGILWALPRPAPACIMIYPSPPECATGAAVLPFLVLIVGFYAAIVTCGLLIPSQRRPLVLGLLAGAMGLVFLIGVATALAAAAPPVYYE